MVIMNEYSTFGTVSNHVIHTEDSVAAFCDSEPKGQGTLLVGEKVLMWESADKENKLSLAYTSISLHAISRDTSSFPDECIFCLYETELDGEEDSEVMEIRFVPQDKTSLQVMYDAITEGQNQNPDPDDDQIDDAKVAYSSTKYSEVNDDDENEWYTGDDADEADFAGVEEGEVVFQQGVQMPTQEEFVDLVTGERNGNDNQFFVDAEEGQFDDVEGGEH